MTQQSCEHRCFPSTISLQTTISISEVTLPTHTTVTTSVSSGLNTIAVTELAFLCRKLHLAPCVIGEPSHRYSCACCSNTTVSYVGQRLHPRVSRTQAKTLPPFPALRPHTHTHTHCKTLPNFCCSVRDKGASRARVNTLERGSPDTGCSSLS